MTTLEDLEARAKRIVDAEWTEFMQSLRDYPTYEAWLTGWELKKYGANAANMPSERGLHMPQVE